MGRLLPKCEEIVSQAMGRKITAKESENVIPAIRSQYLQLEKSDPNFINMPHAERVRLAAEKAADLIEADAIAKRQRTALQVLALEKNLHVYKNLNAKGIVGFSAVAERLEQVNLRITAVRQELMSTMGDGFKALGEGRFWGLVEDRSRALQVVKALFGEDVDDPVIKQGAKVIQDTLESIRVRYNALGGNIKHLKDYGLPQSHDVMKVARAGDVLAPIGKSWVSQRFMSGARVVTRTLAGLDDAMKHNRAAWVDFIADKLDRDKYLDLETGKRLNDNEYYEMLGKVYDTLVTDGAVNSPTAQTALAKKAGKGKRGDKHRALHFKDAESWLAYEEMFGNNNIGLTISSHINSMGREIALMQEMGPNPNGTFEALHGLAQRDADMAKLKHGINPLVAAKYRDMHGTPPFMVTTTQMWNTLSGAAGTVKGLGYVADIAQGLRTLQCGGKLGAAFISSFSDVGTYFTTALVHGIPLKQAAKALVHTWSKEGAEFAQQHAILADTMNASLARWGEENIGTGLINTMTEATMRLSLLEGWTNGVRRAMGFLMMDTMHKMRKTDWQDLHHMDRARLEEAGFTEKDWIILQHASSTEHQGRQLLTNQDIKDSLLNDISPDLIDAFEIHARDIQDARTKLLAYYYQEMYMASLNPNLRTRTSTSYGSQKGTVGGELWRSFMLFKSFPFGMVSAHFRRASQYWRHGEKASALKYTGALVATTTALGAVSLQAANLIGGRDLQDMESADFWTNAFLKGGGLGFYGDILYNGLLGENKYGAPNVIGFAGPVFGTMMDAWDTALSVRDAAVYDKDTKAGTKAMRLIRSNTPIINTWYIKGILDRAVFNDLNEMASPGYLRRQEKRMKKSTGQGFWWGNTMLPTRAPTMATQPKK